MGFSFNHCLLLSVQMVASASVGGTKSKSLICIWNVQDGSRRNSISYHKGSVQSLAFSRDDLYLLSMGQWHIAVVWFSVTTCTALSDVGAFLYGILSKEILFCVALFWQKFVCPPPNVTALVDISCCLKIWWFMFKNHLLRCNLSDVILPVQGILWSRWWRCGVHTRLSCSVRSVWMFHCMRERSVPAVPANSPSLAPTLSSSVTYTHVALGQSYR